MLDEYQPSTAAPRAIVEALEEDIVFGRLYPRERLVEEQLALRFKVNRHQAREALAELERMGMIERRRNRGAVVREFTPEDALHIYAVREALEVLAAKTTPFPIEESVLEALERVQAAHAAAVERGDPRATFRRNVEFHEILFGACGNPYLREAIAHFAQRSHAIRAATITDPAYLRAAGEEHWAMIEALREGRRDELAELCRSHILRGRDAYVASYRSRHGER
jgi:DNA-binding GntR family transcriptional regulator